MKRHPDSVVVATMSARPLMTRSKLESKVRTTSNIGTVGAALLAAVLNGKENV